MSAEAEDTPDEDMVLEVIGRAVTEHGRPPEGYMLCIRFDERGARLTALPHARMRAFLLESGNLPERAIAQTAVEAPAGQHWVVVFHGVSVAVALMELTVVAAGDCGDALCPGHALDRAPKTLH